MEARESRQWVIDRSDIDKLINLLKGQDYQVIGPSRQDGTIIYDELSSSDDLPIGWTDRQEAGTYRLERRDDDALFGYVVGPHSWKQFLHSPRQKIWQALRRDGVVQVEEESEPSRPYAFIGVRSCELNAIAVQDRVFLSDAHYDDRYAARRRSAVIIAVDCAQARGTCFCESMDTGPEVRGEFDLALTEILEDHEHRFTVRVGSDLGRALLEELTPRAACETDRIRATEAVNAARAEMGRQLNTAGIQALLQGNADHPRWEEVASRCLSCANCTMVCPTCFCSTVEDVTDLSGEHAERWKRWDSCFTLDFTYVHGGSVRQSGASRYRQWLTHKFAHWHDQFGSSGCVGCGRCITWCPVGIDVTEEISAIREASNEQEEPS